MTRKIGSTLTGMPAMEKWGLADTGASLRGGADPDRCARVGGAVLGAPYDDPDGPLHDARNPPGGRGEGDGRAIDVRRDRAALRPREPRHDLPDGRPLAAT